MKIPLILCIPLFALTSCVIVEVEDEFNYDSATSSVSKIGGFSPSTYIAQNTTRLPVPPFRIDVDKMPRDLVMFQYDGTVLNTDVGFRAFTLEYCFVKFADGTQNDCIDPSLPLSQRTYPIREKNPEFRTQTFEGVISKRMDFEIHMKGVSIRDNGKRVPFQKIKSYRYDGKKAGAKTIFEEWADV